MDPIEKKFQEAFADYQFPVDDGLWDQVLEKKNRRKPFPWMRLAATLALLIVAGFLLWPSSAPEKDMASHSGPVQTEPAVDVADPDVSADLPMLVQENRSAPAARELTHEPAHPIRVATQPDQANETNDLATLESPSHDLIPVDRLPGKVVSILNPITRLDGDRITLPNDIRIMEPDRPIYASHPIKKGISTVREDLEGPEDMTGPARLVGTLQKASPKLFKDILAFSSAESTEIEINW
ncbi:MAG: hypothetical protein H6568_15335 [Lewinellaceae bacterium]|nr:hypothetical protein [Saprospiraceae bacterium]MCB9314130.1 hypothetical protein [Lewinellaceae bacterium]HRW76498.1 hypothetical protein [Saprospiraceae bacterium]